MLRLIYISILLFFFSTNISAQTSEIDKKNKIEYLKQFDRAKEFLSKKEYKKAQNILQGLLKKKNIDIIGCNIKWDGKDAHWMPAEACDLI